ncbi:MAG: cell division protein ZapA [Alphaproteobacteria bacterium]|nr:cell division protein ZapA [Alphaproteobacteria bacterium]
MSQSTVTVRINGQPYQMGCDVGQEAHIEQMGKNVDTIVQQLVGSVGQIGDTRLLAMAGLILSDQAQTASQQSVAMTKQSSNLEASNQEDVQDKNGIVLSHLQMQGLVEQITNLAETIEHLAQSQE